MTKIKSEKEIVVKTVVERQKSSLNNNDTTRAFVEVRDSQLNAYNPLFEVMENYLNYLSHAS